MITLPLEIWERVIQHVEPSAKNICAINSSCRLLRAALHMNNKGIWLNGAVLRQGSLTKWVEPTVVLGWKGYELKISTPTELIELMSATIPMTNYLGGVCDINVMGINANNYQHLLDLFESQRHCPLLCSLTLRFNLAISTHFVDATSNQALQKCFTSTVIESLNRVRSLRNLEIIFCGAQPKPVIHTFGAPMTSLVVLTLLCCGLKSTKVIVQECPFLQKINLRLCYDLMDISSLEHALNLKHVSLFHCPKVERIPRLLQISSLKILGCSWTVLDQKNSTSTTRTSSSSISTNSSTSGLSMCSNIKTLHIGQMHGDLHFKTLPELPPSLSTLYLFACNHLISVSSFVHVSKSIKHVIFYSCNNALDIQTLVNLPNLTTLKIADSYPATPVDLRCLHQCAGLRNLTLLRVGANFTGLRDLMHTRPDVTYTYD